MVYCVPSVLYYMINGGMRMTWLALTVTQELDLNALLPLTRSLFHLAWVVI